MAAKLADRLKQASSRLFVGRQEQCKLFQDVLIQDTFPFSILHIHGPGGIGKTSLLYEFRRLCDNADISVNYLDSRTIEADSVAFTDALQSSLGLGRDGRPETILGAQGRHVLMLDTFEMLFALEQWLYTEFFPELLDTVFIVVAGRYPPSAIWTDNPGWRSLIRQISLRNLAPEESRLYLSKAGIPSEFHQAAIDHTHGHPLALSLFSDSFDQEHTTAIDSDLGPDFIKILLDRFLREAPSLEHRLSLEACAMVNHLTEPLLAEMVEQQEVRALFEWLRNLSFIESGPRGLFPHDLARDVLGAELKWRNPEQHKLLHQRARAFYNSQLQEVSVEEQGNILKDYIFLHKDNEIVRPFFVQLQSQWQGGAAPVSTDRFKENDADVIVDIVSKHEGKNAGEIAGMWLSHQPDRVVVFRGGGGVVEGFLMLLALDNAPADVLEKDDVARSCLKYIEKTAPLRPKESATLFRFWMDAQSYQNISQVQSLIFVYMVRHYLTTPSLAFSMLPISAPDFWKSVFSYADLEHLESLDFEENGIRYGIFGHDWRSRPPAAWLDVLASREMSGAISKTPVEPQDPPVLVLSEEAFGEAVRQVLRNYTRLDKLKKNPLLYSRIVVDQTSADADVTIRITVLMEVLNDAITMIQNNPRQAKTFRALDRTYLRPAASQEQAAELLGLPYSTFRRHLSSAVKELADILWKKELGD